MDKIKAIKGMNDVLPSDSYAWNWLEDKLKKWLFSYGYKNIRTPILEYEHLFKRSIGEVTDIVEKEMYTFVDKLNGDSLALRPEGTASTLRSVIEHNLLYNSTQKLWYLGPMFRHERPQKGRYRQFHQLGVEALGFADFRIDVEIILMLSDLWSQLGLNNLQLQVNCLGSREERNAHRVALVDYFEQHREFLDTEAIKRLYTNPLRILDTKIENMQEIIQNAPKLYNFLGDLSKSHHEQWLSNLSKLNIPFIENHCLVRGLDYYNLSVFEWVDKSGSLGTQATIAAGGRYDPLIADLGGGDNYAIGFAIGIERLILTLQSLNLIPEQNDCDVYVANIGQNTDNYSFEVASKIRVSGYNVIQNFMNISLKSQLKKSSNLNSIITIVIGENEVLSRQVVLKLMASKEQFVIHFNDLIPKLRDLIL